MGFSTVLIVLGISGVWAVLVVIVWDTYRERRRKARMRRLVDRWARRRAQYSGDHVADDYDEDSQLSFRTDDKGRFR